MTEQEKQELKHLRQENQQLRNALDNNFTLFPPISYFKETEIRQPSEKEIEDFESAAEDCLRLAQGGAKMDA